MSTPVHRDREVFFCSAASRYFKEDLAATASNSKSFILLEHSDPFPGKVTEAHFDTNWIQGLKKLASAHKGKLLLIRNKKTNYKDCRIIFVDCIRCRYFVVQTSIENAHQINLADYINHPKTLWEDEPFFAICTNGKKDKCCAKFGYPVYKFFESFNADVSVYECSHMGGDRFAANVVCMPFGIYYGHVAVEDVGHIMVRTLMRKIYRQNYRGLSCRSFFEQAAECHLREYLHNYDIDFPLTISLRHQENMDYEVQLDTGIHGVFLMRMQKVLIDYPHLLTCKSAKPEPIAKFKLLGIRKTN